MLVVVSNRHSFSYISFKFLTNGTRHRRKEDWHHFSLWNLLTYIPPSFYFLDRKRSFEEYPSTADETFTVAGQFMTGDGSKHHLDGNSDDEEEGTTGFVDNVLYMSSS